MKFFRFFGMAVIAICLCTNFTACSKDDDADGGGNTAEKRLTKIAIDEYVFYVFIYDNQGRLVEARSDVYGSDTYKWKDDAIDVYYDGKYNSTYNLTYGLVSNRYRPSEPSQYQYEYYTYNIEGRLVDGLVWEGDKLISMVGWSDYEVTYTYNNTTCKSGYYPLFVENSLFMAHPEIFGMKTNQLPISCKGVPGGHIQAEEFTETYEYEFDAEGYISKIIVKTGSGGTYSYTLTWN